ncbi:hypothetical protein ACJRO7_036018 [Eucalyptus globulus]|uniref:TIR domain-containing protein n=1 Tax=Eucalyptus globulus TaxID=34317 RepID=A0ABD3JC50_EUCGL
MSSHSHQWTPDVFVSFEEKDSKPFILKLDARLREAGFGCRYCLKGNDDLDKTICQARFALVVFSASYVNCSKCQGELLKILLRRGNSKYPNLVVIPIFHGMDPAMVPKLRGKGKFERAHASLHGKGKDEEEEKKKEWSHALAEVERISGYDLKEDAKGDESNLVAKIVKRLVNEISSLYSHKVFGPFGGSGAGDRSWHSYEINGIYVKYKDFIKSIEFKVEENTNPVKQRGEKGRYTHELTLGKGEAITSFSGYFETKNGVPIRINALTFRTNQKNTLGPIGRREGEHFFIPLSSEAGKVIEFFGSFGSENGDDFLTSIGARVELLPPKKFCPVGLFGSRRGSRWDSGNGHTSVKGIRVQFDSSGNRIQSIAFQYDGVRSPWKEYGIIAEPYEEFIIGGKDEYLSSISGYCTYDGITTLAFLTNRKNTKIIGDGKGTHFSSPTTGCKIVGFYGWRDEHLHGIGAYYEPIPDLNPVESFGPFGRAKAWDDGKFSGVKKIDIAIKDYIRYIEIVYKDSDINDRTVIHGDCTGEFSNNKKTVTLNYPSEYLISIFGYTREDGSIQSLTFDSNRKRHGPYGKEEGEYFWYPSNGTKIIGFYGTWGKTLDSIGVYVKPISQPDHIRILKPSEDSKMTNWDDGEHSNVIGYRVTTNKSDRKSKRRIKSITFMYDDNGSLVEGSPHGGGDAGEWVMLDFPKQRLLAIGGWSERNDQNDRTIIHDLQILTTGNNLPYAARGGKDSNKKAYERSTQFFIPEKSDKDRRIIGFFGKADTCLNSIGAHFQ